MINPFINQTGLLPCQAFKLEENEFIYSNLENNIMLDLFDTFVSICYMDFYTPRSELNLDKKIIIDIPVVNLYEMNNIKKNLERIIIYMTNGENWHINFYKYEKEKKIHKKDLALKLLLYDSCALLSGGLDSFCGAYNEILEKNRTLFVTFQINHEEKNIAYKNYKTYFKRDFNAWSGFNKIDLSIKRHYTERTRTLIFIAFGLLIAYSNDIKELKMYENGIMSLNPTFDFSRKVSKTTHPRTLFLINEILDHLDINLHIKNPFEFYTKSEILKLLPKDLLIKSIKSTKTCSKSLSNRHFSFIEKGDSHCGVCIACVLRQISEINVDVLIDLEEYLIPPTVIKKIEISDYYKLKCIEKDKIYSKETEQYLFEEKNSLIAYYLKYMKAIETNDIYNYLDISERFFDDSAYIDKIRKMLRNFSKEIKRYLNEVGYGKTY